jgi:hypothetical protein
MQSRGGDRQQALGCEAEGIEAGAVGCAAFGERHVLGEPENAGLYVRRQPQRKTCRRREMSLACRSDLVQCAAREAAAERCVDDGDAKG